MTHPRLPVKPSVVSLGRRGGGLGEPAPSGSPTATATAQVVATLHQLIDSLTRLSDTNPVPRPASVHSDLPLLLDTSEAAKLLSLSRSKVCQLASHGDIPSIRVGRAVRIPRDPLLGWIDQRTIRESGAQQVRLLNWACVKESSVP
jgi:excisionase family DNA binding protein